MRRALPLFALALLVGCGGVTYTPATPNLSARAALAGAPEALELQSAPTRQELFREVARTSLLEANRASPERALFPLVDGARRSAAPGFELGMDLLQAPDAGQGLQFAFGGRGGERWPEDRRDSLQGLSEREAVELVARTLIAHWGLQPTGTVQIDRASNAPYAVAYVDGILRVNPAFLYLAAAPANTFAAAP